MSISAQALSSFAELTFASYSTLRQGETQLQANALQNSDRGMTPTQVAAFATRFPTIVTQYNDLTAPGGMGTGFNATVFKDTAGSTTPAK